jgi:hypothetical protein
MNPIRVITKVINKIIQTDSKFGQI